jgi:hypothetical protein
MSCQALIQQGERKGELCEKPTEGKYCRKHIRQEIVDKANSENIRYCDVARGCFIVLEEHQTKCMHCLHKAKIRDRKREDKKRQDINLCLDCGNTLTEENRAVGKHDKKLRRCIQCYKKLLEIESKRTPKERNYKSEAFKNKYVIWNHYIKSAKNRGIDFKIKKDIFNSLIIEKCFYCDYNKDGEVNGIDRIDNNKGYLEDNIVTCCEFCNLAKGTQHPQEFIDKLYSIYTYTSTNVEIDKNLVNKWKETYLSKISPKFSSYIKSANTRNIEFKLTEKEFNSILANSCYLCGLSTSDNNKNGIDRVKNNLGYTIENCKSCCGHCNLLKKNLSYEKLLDISQKIYLKYDILSSYFKHLNIPIRKSKVEGRNKVSNPDVAKVEKREYKPLNEIIIPNQIPKEIEKILEKESRQIELKQWKAKQIYEAIQENNENKYKEYCEKNNDISKIKDWDIKWASFVLSVKANTQQESESNIRSFVEDLRRIRHNDLCVNSKNIVERDDRQQWPATTVVKAFLNNKLDKFKQFTEEQSGDSPDDLVWQKRWKSFIKSLEEHKDNEEVLKELCSKFMNAQRIKCYRRKYKLDIVT